MVKTHCMSVDADDVVVSKGKRVRGMLLFFF